ncbi:4-(cytidine 5'-diphospho)-2-C-methyl-D-erythritol kinase [Sphingomonas sp. ID1715]|uniref:4-(cytidine 5'-diphospho)-2-C-methyl-D-erythritol kinase n=1 Tax=Sphingomonas sp. ID1715 TaxID=1656898 RepID=UPI001489DFAE|nr:4-(cytidine 5'-diphospho)-2-C-methyl-D-erythritol kinase [Sphingomonas sp. ID1715]NNM76261.1 4-(cytidine 5'-diphospho)-2-C-methyl-D-erythritol kinase [Sphingomonas sp. ID1715]
MPEAASLTEIAPAKINLALHVRERMPDGYHRIETLFAFAEDGDRLSVSPSDRLTLTLSGPFATGLSAGADNLVLKAAEALRSAAGVSAGAALHLEKNLPVASGIGGGSADAAAALRLLARFWRANLPLEPIAATLGADVPACLHGRTVRGEGRGDRLVPVAPGRLAGMPLLLINPLVPVPTGPVFAAWDGVDRGALRQGDPLSVALAGRNDLQPPAEATAPVIARLTEWLRERRGVLLARMSGSGATCFALFDEASALRGAADEAAREWPDFWTLATRVGV